MTCSTGTPMFVKGSEGDSAEHHHCGLQACVFNCDTCIETQTVRFNVQPPGTNFTHLCEEKGCGHPGRDQGTHPF